MPKISVIVPAYNRANTIEPCLRAIRDSSFADYELIVIDDGSDDGTHKIAEKFADQIISLDQNHGVSYARNRGIEISKGDIIVNIDSDICIQEDSLEKIVNYFSKHQEVDALTGLLSKEHPHKNFFSQYKNCYMHFIFSRLPERVTFLFASICAVRKEALVSFDKNFQSGPDTELGQHLVASGKNIAFLNKLEVVHLKKYTMLSFIKNDFCVPYDWAHIFIKYKGWRQLGKKGVGFCHSPKRQLLSLIVVAAIIALLAAGWLASYKPSLAIMSLLLGWTCLNASFFAFLKAQRGLLWMIYAVIVTFIDHIVMILGIISGFISYFFRKK